MGRGRRILRIVPRSLLWISFVFWASEGHGLQYRSNDREQDSEIIELDLAYMTFVCATSTKCSRGSTQRNQASFSSARDIHTLMPVPVLNITLAIANVQTDVQRDP